MASTAEWRGVVSTGRVFFDELDAMGVLHNSRFAILAERTSSEFFESNGWVWERDPTLNPDQFYVVREQSVRYFEPVRGPGEVAVEMALQTVGESTVTFTFQVRSADRSRLHAEVRHVHVKRDPNSLRPTPWSPAFRVQLEGLLSSGDA